MYLNSRKLCGIYRTKEKSKGTHVAGKEKLYIEFGKHSKRDRVGNQKLHIICLRVFVKKDSLGILKLRMVKYRHW